VVLVGRDVLLTHCDLARVFGDGIWLCENECRFYVMASMFTESTSYLHFLSLVIVSCRIVD
jgi:hypothetical protein